MPPESRWTILDGAPDATLVVDRSGTIVYANSCTAEVLKWLPSDLVGRPVSVLIPKELHELHTRHVDQYQANPKSRMMGAGLELTAVRRDGHPLPVEIALNPLDDGELVMVSIRDIEERVRLSRELSDATARLAVVDERDRIARDLHDRVIQRLFATGLHLQAALGHPDLDDRVVREIDEIDEAIREIRTTIFTMHSPRGLQGGCETALRTTIGEAGRVLGHQPRFHVHGPCALVPEELVVELVDVTRELLSNVAKHAKASTTAVTVEVTGGTLCLSVYDDGVGIDVAAGSPGHGVHNVTERARRRGGSATFAPVSAGGTLVTWSVPLS